MIHPLNAATALKSIALQAQAGVTAVIGQERGNSSEPKFLGHKAEDIGSFILSF